jgi:hypothetical protein
VSGRSTASGSNKAATEPDRVTYTLKEGKSINRESNP